MAEKSRRAVFTGAGLISAIGSDAGTFWTSLIEGKSGIRPIQSNDVSPLPCRIGAEADFDARKWVNKENRKSLKLMATAVQMGYAAANTAIASAGVIKGSIDPTRIGMEFGCGMIATELEDIGRASRVCFDEATGTVDLKKWGSIGLEEIQPTWMLKYLPNMPACHITITHDIQGPNNSITESEAASLIALGEAWRIIERDTADLFVVGGAESKFNPHSLARHAVYKTLPLSIRNDEPTKALRPFDIEADGTVLGEGSAVLILEQVDHATKRGANILGELVGYSGGFDRTKSGRSLAKCIGRALKDAGITPGEIDHICANGCGIPDYDIWEAKAVEYAFEDGIPPVWAPKANFGFVGAAAGTMQVYASLLALQHGQLPPTLNHESPLPGCHIPVHVQGTRPVTKPYSLVINLTDLGQCAVAVLKKWEG
jgi:3-oxoacyl-[acyl-carrier-protein] synthase II